MLVARRGQVFPCTGLKASTAFEENVAEDISCQVSGALPAHLRRQECQEFPFG